MTEPLRDGSVPGVGDPTASNPAESEHAGDASATRDPRLPSPSAVESLVTALLEAGPDVAEHVVRAAQELLLAAQCIVDAADQAVQEQLDVRDHRAETTGAESTAGVDSTTPTDSDTSARVLPLDLRE